MIVWCFRDQNFEFAHYSSAAQNMQQGKPALYYAIGTAHMKCVHTAIKIWNIWSVESGSTAYLPTGQLVVNPSKLVHMWLTYGAVHRVSVWSCIQSKISEISVWCCDQLWYFWNISCSWSWLKISNWNKEDQPLQIAFYNMRVAYRYRIVS